MNFKRTLLVFVAALGTVSMMAQSGVYACGHFRRNRPTTVENLRNSGFTDVAYFNITVGPDGTLASDYNFEENQPHDGGGIVCKDGKYVFGDETIGHNPYFAQDMRDLKKQPTAIKRISICIGGWGNNSYDHIRDLINKYGTDSTTTLYKNWKALLDTLQVVDAVNNDDEYEYDLSTAVKFHEMLWHLGLHTTIAPYTRQSWWRDFVTQVNDSCPGAVDRIWVQCYDGGAGNDPRNWDFNGIERYGGRTNYETNMATSINVMQGWKNAGSAVGGFLWDYNDESWNLNQWAANINRVYGAKTTDAPVATFYSDIQYGGNGVGLPVGEFSQPEMALYGIPANDITSLKVTPGYKVTLYTSNIPGEGDSREFTKDTEWIGSTWNDKTRSIRIEVSDPTGINEISTADEAGPKTVRIYDLSGRLAGVQQLTSGEKVDLKNLNHGIYIVRYGDKAVKISNE